MSCRYHEEQFDLSFPDGFEGEIHDLVDLNERHPEYIALCSDVLKYVIKQFDSKHPFLDHDNIRARMLPWVKKAQADDLEYGDLKYRDDEIIESENYMSKPWPLLQALLCVIVIKGGQRGAETLLTFLDDDNELIALFGEFGIEMAGMLASTAYRLAEDEHKIHHKAGMAIRRFVERYEVDSVNILKKMESYNITGSLLTFRDIIVSCLSYLSDFPELEDCLFKSLSAKIIDEELFFLLISPIATVRTANRLEEHIKTLQLRDSGKIRDLIRSLRAGKPEH